MAYRLLLTVFFFLFSDVHSGSNAQCSKMVFEPNYQESVCVDVSTFYLYAANSPCENCCVKRTLTYNGIDSLNIKLEVRNGTSTTTDTFAVSQMKPDPKYDIGGGYYYYVLNGTDCVHSAVFYDTRDDLLFVFSPEKNPGANLLSTLKAVEDCDLKMHLYDPAVNCEGM